MADLKLVRNQTGTLRKGRLPLHTKLIFVCLGIILSAFGAALIRNEAVKQDLAQSIDLYRNSKEKTFYSTLSSTDDLVTALAYDYTVWDEMVRAIKLNDTAWFDANIPSGLKTYQAERAWVVNADFKPLYSTSLGSEVAPSLPLPDLAQAGPIFFKDGGFQKFYYHEEASWYEVHTAPVQPTADTARVSQPRGYFLVARRLDEAYIKRLEAINDATIQIRPDTNIENMTSITEGNIKFGLTLQGWQGSPIGVYQYSAQSEALLKNAQLVIEQNTFLALALITSLLLILVYLYAAVSLPVRRLSVAMQHPNDPPPPDLMKRQDELGDIARLIDSAHAQSREMVVSLELRQRAEDRAERKAQEAERMNELMVGRELKMIELKKRLAKHESKISARSRKREMP